MVYFGVCLGLGVVLYFVWGVYDRNSAFNSAAVGSPESALGLFGSDTIGSDGLNGISSGFYLQHCRGTLCTSENT